MSNQIAATFLPEFDFEMASTRKVLANCSDALFTWKPHEKSFSMGRLANHVANIPTWTAMTLTTDSLDVAPADGSEFKIEEYDTVEALLAVFDKSVADARALLAATDDATMMGDWSMLMGGKTIFTMPKAAVLRTWVLNHLYHHRAQLGVYLRLNDLPVPGVYGPSADDDGM